MNGSEDVRLQATAAAVRRFLLARTTDRELIEDITQEALVRVAAAHHRLDDGAVRAYALVTARHLLADHGRAQARHGRHQHRLVEYRSLAGPEEVTLEREETDALAAALGRLDPDERALLLAHEAEGMDLASLAEATGVSRGAVAVRLARARALLRLEFLLAFRRASLPTKRCRAVLLALSAGDTRRQDALGASDHLNECEACAALSRPLIERRRAIAGWAWLTAAGAALQRLLQRLRRHPGPTAAVATATVALVAGLVISNAHRDQPPVPASQRLVAAAATTAPPTSTRPRPAPPSPTPTPAPTGSLAVDGHALPPRPDLTGRIGRRLTATAVPVVAVPADEGFWVAPDGGPWLWVQLQASHESPYQITVGQAVDFTGVVRPLTTAPEQLGVHGADAEALAGARLYVDVQQDDLRIETPAPAPPSPTSTAPIP